MTDAYGNSYTYGYDGNGNLVKVTDAEGHVTKYTHDENGRVASVTNALGKTMSYTYDETGNLTESSDYAGNITTYQYDGMDRMVKKTVGDEETTETAYRYDRLNRLVKETTEKDGNRLTQEYSYDKNSNRTEKKVTVKGDITKLADTGLEEVQITEGTTEYTYNALNQLITERGPEGTVTYEYDADGNLTKRSGSRTADYIYDRENRLTKATIQQGNSVTIESYTYDYEGNRTSKTVNENDSVYYVNDTSGSLSMVVAETDSDGNEKAFHTRGDELLSMEKDGKVCYYHYDGHGNVRFLTDSDGNITDSYSYDAYGNLLKKQGKTENDFLYTGEQYNANTGLYYLRARYMDPSTGTFTSMDSYPGSISDPVSLHKYLYANANPVTYTDPSGHMAFMLAGVGALSCSEVQESHYNSVVIHIGRQILSQLRAIQEVQQISYIASSVLIAIAVEEALGESEIDGKILIAVKILENEIDRINAICCIAGVSNSSINMVLQEAIREAKKNKGGTKEGDKEYKQKKKVKGKQKDDIPDRFKGERPYKGESGKDAAKRVLQEHGEYNPKDTGPKSDFNRLKKYFDTHFE